MNRTQPAYAAGVTASLVAEAVFVALVMFVSALRGKDLWLVIRMPGSFLLGPEAVRPPGFVAGDVLIGMAAHLWLGVLVGVIYAASLPHLEVSPVVGGMITAGVLYVLGFWILPQLFPGRLSPFWLPPIGRVLQAGAHVLYGLVFGCVYGRIVPR